MLQLRFLKRLMIVASHDIVEISVHTGVLGQDGHDGEALIAGRAEWAKTLDVGDCHTSLEYHTNSAFLRRGVSEITMRRSIRRFTRLTNGFSKKWENHWAALALYFAFYNFCRIHSSIRVTPAMQAGITDHVWDLAELLD